MSRTHRNFSNDNVYRKPKTFNERKQLESLLHNDEVILRNRDRAKINSLRDVYDDIAKSGYFEDYDWKHHWD